MIPRTRHRATAPCGRESGAMRMGSENMQQTIVKTTCLFSTNKIFGANIRFSQKIHNNLTIRHLQSTRLFYSFKFLIPHRETCLIEGRKTPNRNTKDARWRLDGLAFATRLGIFPETENDRGGFHLKKNLFSRPISPINATQLSHQRFGQWSIIGNQASAYRCAWVAYVAGTFFAKEHKRASSFGSYPFF